VIYRLFWPATTPQKVEISIRQTFTQMGQFYQALADNSGEVAQDLFLELQGVIRLTAQAFKDLGAAVGYELSQREFSELLAAVDVVSQRLEHFRAQRESMQFSLDAIIAFSNVILQMKEITDNLNQMAQGWPSSSLLSSNSTSAV
jgi:hypothetical protein